jgi:hypothetical protein
LPIKTILDDIIIIRRSGVQVPPPLPTPPGLGTVGER